MTLAILTTIVGPLLAAMAPVLGKWLMERMAGAPARAAERADQGLQEQMAKLRGAKTKEEYEKAEAELNADFDADFRKLGLRADEVRDDQRGP